jgi:hypothetical protein
MSMSPPGDGQEPGLDEPERKSHRLRWLIAAVVIVGSAVGVAAIVGSGSGAVETSYTAGESCTSADVEANVRLTVYSSAGRSACEVIDRTLGRQGSYWRVQPSGAELEGELVCSLAKEHTLVEVRDTGGHFYGNRFCAFFTGKGWTEQEGPGGQIERERAKHESEAKEARERREHEEETERQRTETIEQRKQEVQEKAEQANEAGERKKEEAQQAAQETKEQEEHKAEEAKEQAEQHAEQQKLGREETQRKEQEARERKKEAAEREAEQHKTEEESKRAEREAQRE